MSTPAISATVSQMLAIITGPTHVSSESQHTASYASSFSCVIGASTSDSPPSLSSTRVKPASPKAASDSPEDAPQKLKETIKSQAKRISAQRQALEHQNRLIQQQAVELAFYKGISERDRLCKGSEPESTKAGYLSKKLREASADKHRLQTTVDEQMALIHEKDRVIQSLQSKKGEPFLELRREIKALQVKHKQAQETIQSLQDTNSQLAKEKASHQEEVQRLSERVNHLVTKERDLTEELAQLREAHAQLQYEKNRTEREFHGLLAHFVRLRLSHEENHKPTEMKTEMKLEAPRHESSTPKIQSEEAASSTAKPQHFSGSHWRKLQRSKSKRKKKVGTHTD